MNTRGTIISRAVLDQLARENIEYRTMMANRAFWVLSCSRSVADRRDIESKSWWGGTREVPVERGWGISGCVGM
jgi:hypothetical protein